MTRAADARTGPVVALGLWMRGLWMRGLWIMGGLGSLSFSYMQRYLL